VLVTSRSFHEYTAMFALRDSDLSGRILDCSAGASDFAAVAAGRGARVVAADPAYALPRAALVDRIRADGEQGAGIAQQFPDRFTWRWYGDAVARDRMRQEALGRFATDVVARPQRYVAAQLPHLSFRDRCFDLAVCSHLLFTWADQLGLDWHHAALVELARVAREVRVFPTVRMGAGEPVPFWDELLTVLAAAGLSCELRRVDYEFQVGADQMLVVTGS
jgi:hypothetical protein